VGDPSLARARSGARRRFARGVIWLLNFHGSAAVLWSAAGRRVLTPRPFAGAAFVRGRIAPALPSSLALFAESVLLPAVLFVWGGADDPPGGSAARRLPTATIRQSLDRRRRRCHGRLPGVGRSSRERRCPRRRSTSRRSIRGVDRTRIYADRALTWPLIVCVVAAVILGGPVRPATRRTIACGLVWLCGGFALTAFLPVRSDLYACFPSVGASLAAAAVCSRAWQTAAATRRQRALVAAIVVAMAAGILHYVRTGRWVAPADFASSTLADLETETNALPDGAIVVLRDDRTARVNLGAAFGTLMNDAYTLSTGRRLQIWIDPPPVNAELAGLTPPCPACADLRLAVADGRLRRERRRPIDFSRGGSSRPGRSLCARPMLLVVTGFASDFPTPALCVIRGRAGPITNWIVRNGGVLGWHGPLSRHPAGVACFRPR
jgi:hypothetical protein